MLIEYIPQYLKFVLKTKYILERFNHLMSRKHTLIAYVHSFAKNFARKIIYIYVKWNVLFSN